MWYLFLDFLSPTQVQHGRIRVPESSQWFQISQGERLAPSGWIECHLPQRRCHTTLDTVNEGDTICQQRTSSAFFLGDFLTKPVSSDRSLCLMSLSHVSESFDDSRILTPVCRTSLSSPAQSFTGATRVWFSSLTGLLPPQSVSLCGCWPVPDRLSQWINPNSREYLPSQSFCYI